MPRVALPLAAWRFRRNPGLSPPRGAWLGLFLTLLGLVLLAIATGPTLVGAATTLTCAQDGTDTKACVFDPEAEAGVPIASLKTADKPVDAQLAVGGRFIRDQRALVQLGKALFWDQQVGSDGQACGTCHFSAGADARTKNQTSPGLKATPVDNTFQNGLGPNHVITAADFPFHKLANPDDRNSRVLRDSNDVMSSAGVFNRTFVSIQANQGGLGNDRPAFDRRAMDNCSSTADADGFRIGNINVRRAEPRNTPTMINGLFNNRNFWDSRAQNIFNGVDPFGDRNTTARVFEIPAGGGGPQAVQIGIDHSSLASQSVGPPGNPNEMSCNGRTFPDVGHKMLTSTSTPLAQQDVSASDSVLGPISFNRATGGRTTEGLNVSYRELVQRAIQPRWWASNASVNVPSVPGARPQIEANFSLFWGLSVGAYMETLRADDSEIDQFFDGSAQLSQSELRGLLLFSSAAGTRPSPIRNPTTRVPVFLADGKTPADLRCTACHGGPEMTAASIDAVTEDARLERMAQLDGRCAIYDAGHFYTGVRHVNDDLSLGFTDAFGNSFGETRLAQIGQLIAKNRAAVAPFGLVPGTATRSPDTVTTFGTVNCDGDNVDGTFKAPSLRNVELTGPYFHNGGELTLRQVVDFYNRGGSFGNSNVAKDRREFDPNIHPLNLATQDKNDLVAFLLALTDRRVAFERAPFDHPGICVADGHPGNETSTQAGDPLPGGGPQARALFIVECHPASGANGLQNRIQPFLGVNQFDATP